MEWGVDLKGVEDFDEIEFIDEYEVGDVLKDNEWEWFVGTDESVEDVSAGNLELNCELFVVNIRKSVETDVWGVVILFEVVFILFVLFDDKVEVNWLFPDETIWLSDVLCPGSPVTLFESVVLSCDEAFTEGVAEDMDV